MKSKHNTFYEVYMASSSQVGSSSSSTNSSPTPPAVPIARRASKQDVTEFYPGGKVTVTGDGHEYKEGDSLPEGKAGEIKKALAIAQEVLNQSPQVSKASGASRRLSPRRTHDDPLDLEQKTIAEAVANARSNSISDQTRQSRLSAPIILRVTSVDGRETPIAKVGYSDPIERSEPRKVRTSFAESSPPRRRSSHLRVLSYAEAMASISPDKRTLLTISDPTIKELTEDLLQFSKLEDLTIKDCSLLVLLLFIDKLNKLKKLTITGTAISEIPIPIMKMPSLEELDVRGNPNLLALPTPPVVQKGINKGDPSFPCGANLKRIFYDKGLTVPENYTKWGTPELYPS